MKDKCCCFFIFLFSIGLTSVKSAYWIPEKKMPYEIESIVRSIQWDNLKNDLKENMQNNVGKIDFMMSKVPESDLYFISKTTIYKYLLENRPSSKISKNFYDSSPFLDFKIKKGNIKLVPFGEWLLSVILRDLNEIYHTPDYKKYLKSRKDSNFTTPKTNKMAKQLNLIVPWFVFFQERSIQEINWELQFVIDKVLVQLGDQLKIYWELKTGAKITWPNHFKITWFSYKKRETQTQKDSLSEIVEGVVQGQKLQELPAPTDDWNMRPSDFASNLTPILKNQEPDPQYSPPEKLPEPVDDWIFE